MLPDRRKLKVVLPDCRTLKVLLPDRRKLKVMLPNRDAVYMQLLVGIYIFVISVYIAILTLFQADDKMISREGIENLR